MPNNNFMDDMMESLGMVDNKEYRCISCTYPLEKIIIETTMKKIRKLFYCRQKKCTRFGTVTVIAK